MRAIAVFVLLIASLVTLAGSSASGQLAGKGSIEGTVTDQTGATVPNAAIVATSTTRGLKLSTRSTSAGDYALSALDPDVYILTVTAQGFATMTQQNVQVNALEISDVNFMLKVGSETQTVTVSTAPPALETSNATLGATMEHEMYSALPIEMGAYGNPDQRRATDFAFLMPGVQGNNTTGNPTTNTGIVNGSGSRGGVSDVYINGIPFVRAGGNGDPRYVWTAISVDAIDQFQVQTSGYSAIYEGQGVQNYSVKQGGNTYHGAAYEFFRNTALDTWGFFGANNVNPATHLPLKPIEHSNEYGVNLGGPLVPFSPRWKDKLFFFGNYNGFRYSSQTPTSITFPTTAEQAGNFAGLISGGIYDPFTQATCTAHSNSGPCRYRYGYGPGGGIGKAGNPALTGAPVDVIPTSEFSQIALKLQSYLPAGIGTAPQNNFISPNATGLTNWSTTDRIDYVISSKDTLSMVAAIGRQASSNPVGQTTAGRNVGPVPYNFGQTYAPKTAVGIIEETHIFSPQLVNQFKYGYARYNGPTFQPNNTPAYAASTQGITGLPAGQAAGAFPFVNFAGTNAPTNWSGETASVTIAENYTLLDNVQWNVGKHSFTFGGQIAWLLYQVIPDTGGSSPLTISNAVSETAGFNPSTNGSIAATANTGLAYASFLIGEIDKGSMTQNVVQEYGSRFRAISPYVQDNWKITGKLTLDLGLRYDFFPALREVHDNMSFFNRNLANPVTGVNGALQYTGAGSNTCNCSTPVNNYFKNIGPRIGLAYQVDPKTVIRTSYGVMFTHGNAVGGGSSTAGLSGNTLGFSASPSFSSNAQLLTTFPLTGTSDAFPSFTPALGRGSGPAFGTGYTRTSGYTGTPSSVSYYDPYLGGRAPEYINWTFGFQHQWTTALTSNITYVGSQGHFLPADGTNARGFWANQLDPKYLGLGSNLALSGANAASYCAANGLPCPANFTASQQLSVELEPFPFAGVTDQFGNVANASYHALQAQLNMRPSHGLTFMASYTWSRSIDDGGTFRTGYPIPAAFSGNGRAWAADRIERSVSTSNQPQHAVVTGVWVLPFGRTVLADSAWTRAVLGGFQFSEIFQAFSGSPLAITSSSCGTNPAQNAFSSPAGSCMPTYNPAFSGSANINGKWGHGVTRTTFNSPASVYINSSAFMTTPSYVFGDTARTAPYNLYGPGNYDLDISLRRSFALHLSESSRLSFQADLYNVSNHTQFTVASAVFGNASFGQVSGTQANTRRSAQLSARIEF